MVAKVNDVVVNSAAKRLGAEGLKFFNMSKIVAGQKKISYSVPTAGELDYRL